MSDGGGRLIGIATASLLRYTPVMALKTSVPVRFGEAQQARLRAVSERTGIGMSALIRMATERFLDEVEAEGEVVVPLNVPRVKRPQPKAGAMKGVNPSH